MASKGVCRVLRRVHDEHAGISLIEVIIAMFILSVGILALASAAITSVQSTRVSQERQDATQLASRILEEARSYDYERLALDSDVYDMSVAANASYDGEAVVAVSDGAVQHEATEGILSSRTWVTWTSVDEDEKRVTVVVEWTDGGRDREVRQSTLVTDAQRGLPVPNFQLTPPEQDANPVSGEVACFDHELTNLGERDSYSWELRRQDGSGGWSAAQPQTRHVVHEGTTVQGYNVPDNSGPGKGWFAWAKIGPTESTLTTMVDNTSDGRPDSASPVERRGQALLRICYTPLNTSGDLRNNIDPAPIYTSRVFSAFDETVMREVVDSLTVISNRYVLNLHHVYKNNGDPETDNQHNYDLLMDRAEPIGTTADVDYDRDGVQGLEMPSGQVASFYFQNTEETSLNLTSSDADVRVSAATASSLAGEPAGWMNLHVSLHHVPATGTPVLLGEDDEQVTPAAGSWTSWTDDIDDPQSTTLAQNDYLRLDVECETEANETCHIHYDVAGVHVSRLEVTVE